MEKTINAVMIRCVDYGENDKILTLLSAEEGKVSTGIKGVRKPGAKLKFAAQPFCFCEYTLSHKGSRNTVTGASEIESFFDLRGDIEKYFSAGAVCETSDALTEEGFPCPVLFRAVVEVLGAICNGDPREELLRFLLKALDLSGYGVTAGRCPVCGEDLSGRPRLRFDLDTGAFMCEECAPSGLLCSGVTYETIRHMGEEGERNPDGVRRALKLTGEYIRVRTDREIRSLAELLREM